MNKQQIVLAIETATNCGSVSVLLNQTEIDFRVGESQISRSEDLIPLISDLLSKNKIDRREVGIICVALGPGSFTGLRVGISTAKGFSTGTGAISVGVPTLDALAASAEVGGKVRSLISYGRDKIYLQDFNLIELYKPLQISEIRSINVKNISNISFMEDIDAMVLDAKHKNIFENFSRPRMLKWQPENLAKYVGLIAVNQANPIELEHLEPIYGQRL